MQRNAQIQRNQFEAEKKVAVADTSIQNLQRSIQQMEEEQTVATDQLKQLEEERVSKGTGTGKQENRSAAITGTSGKNQGTDIANTGRTGETAPATGR